MENGTLVEAVKAHAAKNYERGGWDIVVECYEDSEILNIIGNAATAKDAIKRVAVVVGVHDDYRKDIEAEAF